MRFSAINEPPDPRTGDWQPEDTTACTMIFPDEKPTVRVERPVVREAFDTGAIAETIRELGSIPSGHLYAQLLGRMSHETYASIIALLKRAELVSESGNVLRWIGPTIEAKP